MHRGWHPSRSRNARAVAAEYAAWGRVDELRWAPFLCRIPQPGVARVSASDHVATHGQKLYSIFAKNHAAYPNGPHTDQVIVKEAWTVTLVTDATFEYDPEARRSYGDGGDHFYEYARKDGLLYRAAERAGIYIMHKLDPCTADTDSGWVYATVDTSGKIAAGAIGSCMTCHQALVPGRRH
jgi:hypothetical protein